MPWYGPYPFGAGSDSSEAALTQSNLADPGNLEVVAESADTLEFFWRDSRPSFTCSGPTRETGAPSSGSCAASTDAVSPALVTLGSSAQPRLRG
jgi:hypothetical protein